MNSLGWRTDYAFETGVVVWLVRDDVYVVKERGAVEAVETAVGVRIVEGRAEDACFDGRYTVDRDEA